MVDGNNNRHTKAFEILNMAAKICTAGIDRIHIFRTKVGAGHAAIHLHGAYGGDQNHDAWRKAGLAAFYVHEFLGTKIGTKPGFGNNIVGQFQRRLRSNHRVASMRDIGKWAAMHKGRVVFKRLHQIGLQRLR